jgi:hypothetical protein
MIVRSLTGVSGFRVVVVVVWPVDVFVVAVVD